MAVEEASFSTSIDWISEGLMPSRPLEEMIPSITYKGSLLLLIEVVPRTRTFMPAPGTPLVAVTSTPGVRPWSIFSTRFTGWFLNCLVDTPETDPVKSLFLTVPYPTTTTSSSNWLSSFSMILRVDFFLTFISCGWYPM